MGIHLNLTQGRPLTSGYPPELLDGRGCFAGIGRLFAFLHRRRPRHEPALLAELSAQVEFLRDHGQRPTHLNGHQYVELLPGLRPALHELLVRHQIPVLRLARERGLLRSTLLYEYRPSNWCIAHVKRFYAGRLEEQARRWGVALPHAYFGTSHAGRINLDVMRRYLRSAAGCGLIEIGVHPATDSSQDASAKSAANGRTHDGNRRAARRRLGRSLGRAASAGTRDVDQSLAGGVAAGIRSVAGPPEPIVRRARREGRLNLLWQNQP